MDTRAEDELDHPGPGVPGLGVLGLDIGGTKLAAGVVDSSGALRSFVRIPTGAASGPSGVLDGVFALGREAMAKAGAGADGLAAVGIGCGGPLDTARGVVHNPPNLPGWADVPVSDLARQEFGLPVSLENDGVAAALAEQRYGAGRGSRSLVYLTVSTGVGGGVILDGRPLRGRTGNGGEPGHMIVVHGGRPCPCGSQGCLEAYASGTQIAARAGERLARGHPSVLRTSPAGQDEGTAPTAQDVARAAAAGDRLAAELWQETAEILGTGIANLINLFEPDLVVLGGGVTRSGSQLLDPVRRRAAAATFAAPGAPVPIVPAELGERVGVVGAAAASLATLRQGEPRD